MSRHTVAPELVGWAMSAHRERERPAPQSCSEQTRKSLNFPREKRTHLYFQGTAVAPHR